MTDHRLAFSCSMSALSRRSSSWPSYRLTMIALMWRLARLVLAEVVDEPVAHGRSPEQLARREQVAALLLRIEVLDLLAQREQRLADRCRPG